MTKPYFNSYENPLYNPPGDPSMGEDKSDSFTHYEIQTVRLLVDAHGETYFSVCWSEEDCADDHPEAAGPVLFGVYGRMAWGGADNITDFAILELAENFLAQMGVLER